MAFVEDLDTYERQVAKQAGQVTAIFRRPKDEELRIDKYQSAKHGRTVYVDEVMCEVRIPADNGRRPVFPAEAVWKKVQGRPITYRERFPKAWDAFKRGEAPLVEGTPIEVMPLTPAKKAELKALAIYSVEQLAALDVNAITKMGPGGRDLVEQAKTFLKSQDIKPQVLAAENEELKRRIAALEAASRVGVTEPMGAHQHTIIPGDHQHVTASVLAEKSADELKDFIRSKNGGKMPPGNHSHQGLVQLAQSLAGE